MAIYYFGFRDAEDDGSTGKPSKLVYTSLTELKTVLKEKAIDSEWTVKKIVISGSKAHVKAFRNPKKVEAQETWRFEVKKIAKTGNVMIRKLTDE